MDIHVELMISGRNYHQSGSLPRKLSLHEGATIDDALAAVQAALPEDAKLPRSCLIAVSGTHIGTVGSHQAATLKPGDELMLFLPIAGG
ncbi:MAG: MoaD/ThiS family protein [Planctomycetota bacterium]